MLSRTSSLLSFPLSSRVILTSRVSCLSTKASVVDLQVEPAPAPPKRPTNNPYALFVKQLSTQRPENVSTPEWFVELPKKWTTLSHEDKNTYAMQVKKLNDQYKHDLAKYEESYTPAQRAAYQYQKKAKELARVQRAAQRLADIDNPRPKAPKNPWLAFMMEFRTSFAQEGKSLGTVAKEASSKWNSMTESEKAPFFTLAEKNRKKHETKSS